MRRLRDRLTYANVVSTLCLFLLLGGGAYAATQLPKDSVGTKQLKNGAVTSVKVKDQSLQATDFKPGQLPQGEKGEKGEAGTSSPAPQVTVRQGKPVTAGTNGKGSGCVDGVPGNSDGYYEAGSSTLIPCTGGAGGNAAETVACKAGEQATGGGYTYETGKRHALVVESVPDPEGEGQTPTGWHIQVETLTDDSSNTTPVTPYVVCMRP